MPQGVIAIRCARCNEPLDLVADAHACAYPSPPPTRFEFYTRELIALRRIRKGWSPCLPR